MYGYIVPQKNELLNQDFVLYRAFYCGICKATGSLYGQLPRFTTNYDMTFLTALLHDFLSQDVTIEESSCVLNPFKKKATICRNELMDQLVAVNILLAYAKADDGIADRDGIKHKAVKEMMKKAYKNAQKAYPDIDLIIKSHYKALAALEKAATEGIDIVSHCFSSLLSNVAKAVLKDKADDNIIALCYNIGKFVYLADALDDIDEDYKKKRYNPFLATYKNYIDRRQFIEQNRKDIEFALAACCNRATECFNDLRLTQSNTLLTNIVHKGLRMKMHELLESKKKLSVSRI